METPLQQLERLVQALDTLVAREAALIAMADWDGASAVQDRMQSLVGTIVPLSQSLSAESALPPTIQSKISSIMARQRISLDLYRAKMMRLKEDITNTLSAQKRLATVRPVYFAPKTTPRAIHQSSVFSERG